MNEKGGIPSLEFAISALLFFALIGAGLLGFLTGNWIALKAIAGFIVVLIIYVVVLGFFEDLAYTRRKRSLYKDLVRLLKPAKKNKDTLAIEDTAKRIQNHKLFPTEFFNEAAKLVDLYRHVHSSQRAMARSILLRSIPFDLQTLALFLAIPVVDDMSETSFKRWLWGANRMCWTMCWRFFNRALRIYQEMTMRCCWRCSSTLPQNGPLRSTQQC